MVVCNLGEVKLCVCFGFEFHLNLFCTGIQSSCMSVRGLIKAELSSLKVGGGGRSKYFLPPLGQLSSQHRVQMIF